MVALAADRDHLAELIDIEAIRALKAQRQFRHFAVQAWDQVEPGRELVPGFYVDAICDHLQAVAEGDITRLVITLPPGFLKSTLVSVLFPAWLWIDRPSFRFLTTSHDSDLAMRDAVRSRRVMTSDWYQARWGDRFAMTTDQNVKTRYENDRTGHRISLGTDSSVTGKRGDMILCDDPHDAEDAYSPTAIATTVRWWNETMPSRLNDPKTGAKIVIQQRIHVDDLAGVVIDQGYEHLNLPMEYDPALHQHVTSIGWKDPRTEPGALLDPVRYGPKEVAEKKREMGSRAYGAQFQQAPILSEGGILKRHWFGAYDAIPPSAFTRIQSWDTAFKTGTGNDYSVCATLSDGQTGMHLQDVYREQLEYPDLKRAVIAEAARFRPHAILIEDKASGQSLIQDLRRETKLPIIAISVPPTKDYKIARVHEIAPYVESGRFRLPIAATWLDEAIAEMTAFPLATHDDITDAVAQGIKYLLARNDNAGGTDSYLPDVDDDDDEDLRAWRR